MPPRGSVPGSAIRKASIPLCMCSLFSAWSVTPDLVRAEVHQGPQMSEVTPHPASANRRSKGKSTLPPLTTTTTLPFVSGNFPLSKAAMPTAPPPSTTK